MDAEALGGCLEGPRHSRCVPSVVISRSFRRRLGPSSSGASVRLAARMGSLSGFSARNRCWSPGPRLVRRARVVRRLDTSLAHG